MLIKAVVPVRSNSMRCKNKNFRNFADSSIFQIKIHQLKRIDNIDGIMVISDDDDSLAYAADNGCEIYREEPVPPENISANTLFKLIASVTNATDIVIAHATSPLLRDKSLENAIDFYQKNRSIYDSVNSALEIRKFIFWNGKPLNYDPLSHPRSQDLTPIIARIPAFSIMSRQLMLSRCANTGTNPYLFPVSEIEAIDVDTEEDFEYAEFIYKKYYQ